MVCVWDHGRVGWAWGLAGDLFEGLFQVSFSASVCIHGDFGLMAGGQVEAFDLGMQVARRDEELSELCVLVVTISFTV